MAFKLVVFMVSDFYEGEVVELDVILLGHN